VFRATLRTALLSQLAPARPFAETRRRLVGVMQSRIAPAVPIAARPSAPAAEPGFRAPWGELERQIPYVVITTQPWPTEWWRAPMHRAAAAQRATAQPADLLTRSGSWDGLAALATAAAAAPGRAIGVKVWDTPEHTTAHDRSFAPEMMPAPEMTAPEMMPAPDHAPTPEPVETPVAAPRIVSESRAVRRARAKENRRGLFTRLAIVAFGLIVSLIAVETATRRRA
jgi:hypothetical protein